MNKRQLGSTKEKEAGAELERRGYEIETYNFRCRIGEIDIIAKQGGCLVFVEVKYRKDDRMGDPALAVNQKKQRTICKVADYYKMVNHLEEATSCRFDVVAITGGQIRVIENAFSYCH
ncbi:MAG: YraN family protein [Lachnospiraceae bacterium]